MKRASETFRRFRNPNGPQISTAARSIIRENGLYFKDIDGSGTVSKINDWRLPAVRRAEALAAQLTTDQKIALLFISDWRMGPKYPSTRLKDHVAVPDDSGVLDEAPAIQKNIFGTQELPGTSDLLCRWFARHIILREDPTAADMTDYLNQLQAVAETCRVFIPVQAASNSRNENGEAVFGMNDASGTFPCWPGTLGIAAAVRGNGMQPARQWAEAIRRSWNACGLRKGYMYMADCMTDPRWQRTFGTLGEDPQLICDILATIIPIIQGSDTGVTADGVAMTIKHFPGGGARQNGFDPHYAAGQWNVYRTPGSLQKYHMPPFLTAVRMHTSSVMPYYSKPSAELSASQQDFLGNTAQLVPYGFAYNRYFIQDILRNQMGFDGYVNSDTGIIHNMKWGVEMLDEPERIGFAVSYAGVDLISGLFDNAFGRESYMRAHNGYYASHPLPAGFTPEMVTLSDAALDRAVIRTLTEMFQLGMFEDPYRDPTAAEAAANAGPDRSHAALAHRQSVVLLKNHDHALPLCASGIQIYCRAFGKDAAKAEQLQKTLQQLLPDCQLTEDPNKADAALLLICPGSGNYFHATTGYLELDICENKTVQDVDAEGRPCCTTHQETTLADCGQIPSIAAAVHAHCGKVIAAVNFPLAWLVGNIESCADALVAGFDTLPEAILDVIFGKYAPTGKLPITLPRSDAVIAVNADGICVSPNDVPGYDKDRFMPEHLKDENRKAYAYRDQDGNYYELDFGLRYES